MELLHDLATSLKRKNYEVKVFETSKEARAYLLSLYQNKTIGIGGSVTIDQLDVYQELSKNNKVYSNFESPQEQTYIDSMRADVYMTSVNAITKNGEIINIDGRGNRVAATIYGPSDVVYVIGKNKIEDDIDAAIYRARHIAAPQNTARLNKKTPCVKTGKCMDCTSPERICNTLNIMLQKTYGIKKGIVILINEDLGY